MNPFVYMATLQPCQHFREGSQINHKQHKSTSLKSNKNNKCMYIYYDQCIRDDPK